MTNPEHIPRNAGFFASKKTSVNKNALDIVSLDIRYKAFLFRKMLVYQLVDKPAFSAFSVNKDGLRVISQAENVKLCHRGFSLYGVRRFQENP